MAKEFVISTSRINSYGFRVLTSGIDISQYIKNPILLWMHRRAYEGESMPIGYVINLRFEGDQLIGEPVFDMDDPFAAKIANKWEKGFLRMCSAGLEPLEISDAPEHLLQGQTRPTVTRSRLEEISIADIGSNDDSLQLMSDGKIIKLSANEDNTIIPLLKKENETDTETGETSEGGADHITLNNKNEFQMNLILLALGLADTATESDAVKAIQVLQTKANQADTLQLSYVTSIVDKAIEANPKLSENRDHFIQLGKTSGLEALTKTLSMIPPVVKPTDFINHSGGSTQIPENVKLTDLPEDKVEELRTNNRPEYIRLYKKEFGVDPVFSNKQK